MALNLPVQTGIWGPICGAAKTTFSSPPSRQKWQKGPLNSGHNTWFWNNTERNSCSKIIGILPIIPNADYADCRLLPIVQMCRLCRLPIMPIVQKCRLCRLPIMPIVQKCRLIGKIIGKPINRLQAWYRGPFSVDFNHNGMGFWTKQSKRNVKQDWNWWNSLLNKQVRPIILIQ